MLSNLLPRVCMSIVYEHFCMFCLWLYTCVKI
nr:MAG TPA: hypothetical protein [Caudoviricetes sp.]